MRRVVRVALGAAAMRELKKKQTDANTKCQIASFDSTRHWKTRRSTKPLLAVEKALKEMAGGRERCMYCLDSHGTDIEHFWPKGTYPDRMYSWPNLLLCCTDCGRIKGDEFPLGATQQPLLIDPSAEDPWDFIDFDPGTGNLTARFDPATDDFLTKGVETVRVLELDRREALAEGYKKSCKRLKSLLQRHLDQGSLSALPQALVDEDDHGLLGWFLKAAGQEELPFKVLRDNHPAVWQQCLNLIP